MLDLKLRLPQTTYNEEKLGPKKEIPLKG